MTRRMRTTTSGALAVAIATACGASDRKVDVADGGRSGEAGEGVAGSDGPGGNSTGGSNQGGSGNAAAAGGDPGDAGDNGAGGTPPACVDGEARCAGDTPEVCESELWVPQTPCGGDTPACTNGICAGARLAGHVGTVGAMTPSDSIRLADHGFEFVGVMCGMVRGRQLCVSGGIRP